MSVFPCDEQQDLVMTSSINWSSDSKKIIEADEKEFEENKCIDDIDCNDINNNHNVYNSKLDESWGIYFAKKSPPMGNLCGAGAYRPCFEIDGHHKISSILPMMNKNNDKIDEESELDQETESMEKNNNDKMDEIEIEQKQQEKEKEIDSNSMSYFGMEDDTENNDMVVINIDDVHKSLENINFNDLNDHYLSNRDSNSTQNTNETTQSNQNKSNKFIKIPSLKHIQRFYQFAINQDGLNKKINIEQQIESMILNYIDSFCKNKNITATLSAITYKKNTNKCTVLILFDDYDSQDDEWINHFVSFPSISKILNNSIAPFFTQLSAN